MHVLTQGGRTLSALSGRSLEVNAPATEVTQLPSGLRVASEVREARGLGQFVHLGEKGRWASM